MGLSAMSDAPDMDQAMRFANIAGQFNHIPQNAWLGEHTMNGLGLGDGAPGGMVANNINAATAGIASIIDAIGRNKSGKKGHGQSAPPQASPVIMQSDGGGEGMGKWYLVGGAVVVGAVVLYLVMKKKKTAGDH